MARKRIIVKLTDENEIEQLSLICGALRVRPEDFLRSVIPHHFAALEQAIQRGELERKSLAPAAPTEEPTP